MKESTILMRHIIKYEGVLERLEEGRNSITLRLNDDNGETKKLLIEFFTKKKFDTMCELKKLLKVK